MSKLKSPPLFNPDEDSYERYKNDINIWESYTTLENAKKGPAVYLSLTGKAREAVRDLKAADINQEDGLQKVLEKLDKVYLKDKNTRAFHKFQKFYECKRSGGETIDSFIVKFEQLYHDLTEFEMALPEGVRAFFLLNACNLSDDVEKLARATTSELTYENMKDQIKKICGTSTSSQEESIAPPIKEECLYSYGRNSSRNKGDGSWKKNRPASQRMEKKRSEDVATEQRGSNPTNKSGIKFRCFNCDSTNHFAKDCPKKKSAYEVHICLLSAVPDMKQKCLTMEALGRGVLDSGCTKTVSGEIWMEQFLNTLSEEDRNSVKEESSNASFRFGDGVECKSVRCLSVPVRIGKNRYRMKIHVVSAEIPLLISKDAMKQMGMKINFATDMATIQNEEIKLICTSSGHYCVPLNFFQMDADSCNFILTVQNMKDLSHSEKLTKALKLHRQFSHASATKLVRMVKNSSANDREFVKCIKEVCNKCDICEKYKPALLTPIVSLPLAEKFNQVVCLDLKEIPRNGTKMWILHLIDAATKYSAARLIMTKKKEVIVQKLFEMWIQYFGCPKKLMSDNGGEFANDLYYEVSERLGIEVTMPPAASPFSNGIVERHNKILYETMRKTVDDVKCDLSVGLAWSCSAKNALQNNDGFSPNQLVFGHNVNLPTVLTDELPAMKPTTSSDIIRKNLEALHSARSNYMKAENSNRLRRAFKHQTRTYADEQYYKGDKVFFRRKGDKEWKGPGTVMGSDKYTVLVKRGGSTAKYHRCHLKKINSSKRRDEHSAADAKSTVTVQPKVLRNRSNSNHYQSSGTTPQSESSLSDSSDTDEDNDIDEVMPAVENEQENNDDNNIDVMPVMGEDEDNNIDVEEETLDSMSEDDNQDHQEIRTSGEDDSTGSEHSLEENDGSNADDEEPDERDDESNIGGSEHGLDEDNQSDEMSAVEKDGEMASDDDVLGRTWAEAEGEQDVTEPLGAVGTSKEAIHLTADTMPKPKAYVSFKKLGENWCEAQVLSVQPKRRGVNRFWVNIHIDGQDEPCSVNWQSVEQWKELPCPEVAVFLTAAEELHQGVVDAKAKELANLQNNNVYEVVDYTGQKTISSRWIFTEKMSNGTKVVKARLVARGFEEDSDLLGLRTDSPTCSKQSLRFVMVSSAMFNWELNSMDIAAAFLQGKNIEREVHLRPPKDVCTPNEVWKLNCCIYGLNDASRAWYDKVAEELRGLGATRSLLDPAMYMWFNESQLIGHLVTHVDDFVHGGTPEWKKMVIDTIKKKFKISTESQGSFKYLGLKVVQSNESITIDQTKYIQEISMIDISSDRKKQVDDALSKEEKSKLKSLSGQMLWVTNQTRPDLAFETCMMSNVGKLPIVRKIMDANKAVRKMKCSNYVKIKFYSLGDPANVKVIAYGDGTHASLPDGSSQGGFIVFLCGNGKYIPMLWQSKKLKRITKSALASETLALGETADAGLLIANMMQEIYKLPAIPPVQCYTDSKSLRDALHTSNTVEDMSMRVNIARLREMIDLGEISVKWEEGKFQLADPLTKKGASCEILHRVLDRGAIEK